MQKWMYDIYTLLSVFVLMHDELDPVHFAVSITAVAVEVFLKSLEVLFACG